MLRRALVAGAMLCGLGFCGVLQAQSAKTITLRILDGKTGLSVTPDNFLVRINHEQTEHVDWTTQNGDGSVVLKLPAGATVVAVRATYDRSMEYYVNCDAVGEGNAPELHWYPVGDVLRSGLVTPNGCVKPKAAERLRVTAKPGEYVFFVRKIGWRDRDPDGMN